MTMNLGMVRPGSTILIPFHAFDSNDPSASVIISAFALADIGIYKALSMTERASTTGVVLLDTDGINIDGATGIHGFSIDLSSNATADFYSAGSHYYVTVGPITIDGATVNFVAATFSIGYLGAILDTTIATLASQVSFTITAGPADDDALNGCLALVHDVASSVQVAQALVSDYDETTGTLTVTLAADPGIFTMAAGDNVSFFPAHALAVMDRLLTGQTHNVTNSLGRRIRQIEAAFVVASGTAQAGGAATITLAAGESATSEIFQGDRVVITEGTGVGEHGIVTTYDGSTKVCTMSENWVIQPDNTSVYELQPADVEVKTVGHTIQTAGDLAALLNTIDTVVDAIPTTAMRGTDSAATAANLATVDTVVDAIKVKTDQMVFTKANELDANTQSINGAAVVGDGNATPWDGA